MTVKLMATAKLAIFLNVVSLTSLWATSTSNDTTQQSKVENPCTKVEKAFLEPGGIKPICQCLIDPSRPFTGSGSTQDLWIGCTRQKMPAVFRSLNNLNNTQISHLHIWDSLINILPKEIFAKIRPERLTIETSRVGMIRKEAFAHVGESLRELSLKNNILKTIDQEDLAELGSLTLLDLSNNKLAELKRIHLSNLTNLETLMLNGNQISRLEDGVFQTHSNLKVLNLANNRLKKINRDTFKGLDKLEMLNLRGSRIEEIDEHAFDHLKSLKLLDLSHNFLDGVCIHGNQHLERVMLGNNSIANLANVRLGELPSLANLHLDCNRVSMISDGDFSGLEQSQRLVSLTLDFNNISWIGCRAFEPVAPLSVLSMQRNKISSLSCSSIRDPMAFSIYLDSSVLEPLHSLKKLLLSYNSISLINEDDLTGLVSLHDLALDHNRISKMARKSFNGLKLKKLYLNNNHLYYLPKGVFDGWDLTGVKAVDISENNWECICEQEWIGAWLASIGSANTPSGGLGCLIGKCEEAGPGEQQYEVEGHEMWIRVAACILAFVAILFLIIAGYVYVQESRYTLPIRRASSDTIKLIPSQENLFSFPNPIMTSEGPPTKQDPMVPSSIPPLTIKAAMSKAAVEGEEARKDRKKVRFNE